MNKIQNAILKILLGPIIMISSYGAIAQEKKPVIEPGYNALQASVVLPESERFRAYNNFDFKLPGDLELRLKTMNEVGEKYLGGWNTFSIAKEGSNTELLYVNRAGGSERGNLEVYAQGVGLRAQLYGVLPAGIYGFVDAVLWTDQSKNAGWLGNGELFTFVGKGFKEWNIEMLNVFRPEGNNYAELEIFSPKLETDIGSFRLFGRGEIINYDLDNAKRIVGLQYTVE